MTLSYKAKAYFINANSKIIHFPDKTGFYSNNSRPFTKIFEENNFGIKKKDPMSLQKNKFILFNIMNQQFHKLAAIYIYIYLCCRKMENISTSVRFNRSTRRET